MTTSESERLRTIQSELKLASLGRRKELAVKLSPDLHICTVSSTLTHSTHTSTNNNKEKFIKNKKSTRQTNQSTRKERIGYKPWEIESSTNQFQLPPQLWSCVLCWVYSNMLKSSPNPS